MRSKKEVAAEMESAYELVWYGRYRQHPHSAGEESARRLERAWGGKAALEAGTGTDATKAANMARLVTLRWVQGMDFDDAAIYDT